MNPLLLIVSILLTVSCVLNIMKADTNATRGTNALTTYVRENTAYNKLQVTLGLSTALIVINLIWAVLKGEYIFFIFVLLGAIFLFMTYNKMMEWNKDKERIARARYVTETTGNAVGNVVSSVGPKAAKVASATTTVPAVVAGATKGCAAGTPLGIVGKAGGAIAGGTMAYVATKTAGNLAESGVAAVGDVIKETAGDLDDTESPELFDHEDWEVKENPHLDTYNAGMDTMTSMVILGAGVPEAYPEFRENAKKFGLTVEGKTDDEIAKEFLQYAPAVALENLPDDIDDIEKATRIMTGNI